ncbi:MULTISPECIES: type II toxin-antitoxin system RelE/ParE family toxin [Bacillaceae]|uniref:ParE toxin of type II toxin-antitoxin system, parDE n=1 Tax=Alteribacillus iranensis TaxID=930128 RepID=A0A1I1ZX29_9BACI|nr:MULTISPECIES: type II toxin-antitoxin system RelE/ParE family toxin [Bacillaceae]SFE35203.1 ParE toxin of type II toxin-antitoxin system, parDE [Alteribacillus iranensis]
MTKDNNHKFSVYFTDEFNRCLDQIQAFFAEQGEDVLEWWFSKEDNIIDEIERLLSSFPYAGKMVEQGSFKGLRCLTYGKGRHRMLNYVVFYAVNENEEDIDVINILPSRSKRKRIK